MDATCVTASMEPKFTDEADPRSTTPKSDAAAAGSGKREAENGHRRSDGLHPRYGRHALARSSWQMARPMPIPASPGAKKLSRDMLQVRGGNTWSVVKDGKDGRTFFIDRCLDIDPARSAVPTGRSARQTLLTSRLMTTPGCN